MVGFVRLDKLWELAIIPVELAAVYDDTADLNGMSIHIFTCGMYDDISTEVKRFTENRSCKCVVYDQWNSHCMCNICETLNIKYSQRRVCDCLAKHKLCILFKTGLDLIVRHIFIHVDTFNAKLLQSEREQIDRAAVDFRGTDDAVTSLTDI